MHDSQQSGTVEHKLPQGSFKENFLEERGVEVLYVGLVLVGVDTQLFSCHPVL